MAERVAFIGLGVMGYPMAGWLSRAGHEVSVFNRTSSKAEAWSRDYEGTVAGSPAAAAANADLVFTCVGDDPDLREVVLGPKGLLAAMRPGSIFIDHTTASADLAREIAAAGSERAISRFTRVCSVSCMMRRSRSCICRRSSRRWIVMLSAPACSAISAAVSGSGYRVILACRNVAT